MKIIYHLSHKLKYDCSKSKFIEIDFDLTLKYLKLIYKDFDAFHDKFLVKIEKISDLKSLTEMVTAGFENAIAITATEIDLITNKKIRKRAHKEHSRQNRTSNFERFKSHISKLKAFMNQDSCDDLQSCVEAQNKCKLFVSDYVNTNGKVLQISKIKEYTIIEACEKIDFKLNNIEKLLLKSNVKFLNCSKSNLKEIELNNELQYLNLNKNQLTEIKLTDELIQLNISKNNLKELVCNAKLENLIISRNQLKTIVLNSNLKELNCSKNEISHLDLNPNLLLLNAKENPIKRIKLNKVVKKIKLSYPEQGQIILDNSINNQVVSIHYYII